MRPLINSDFQSREKFESVFGRLTQTTPQTAGLIFTLLLGSVVFIIITHHINLYAHYPFDSDEAIHANRALRLAFDLKRGDLIAFFKDSYQQSVYPPGAAWLQSPFFLLFEASTVTARLFSTLNFVLAGIILYGIALELDDKWGWLIGVIAVFFFFTAQSLLTLSALAMLEMPGLLISFLTLWLYIKSDRRRRLIVLVSLLAALTTLIKYPYGIIILGTLGLAELFKLPAVKSQGREMIGRWLGLFGPAAVLLILWFIGEQKVADFFYYANLQPKQTDWYSVYNILFYPRSFSLHYAGGLGIVLICALAIIYSVYRWRQQNIRVLLLYLLVGTLLMTLKESNNPRFFATIAPAVFLLAGSFVAFIARTLSTRARKNALFTALGGIGIMAVLIILSLPSWYERLAVYPALLETEYETDPDVRNLSNWIVEQAGEQRLYFINPWDQFSNFAMEWHLATTQTYHDNNFGDVFVPDTRLPDLTSDTVEELDFQISFYSTRYVLALEGGLEGRQIWPEYEQALSPKLQPVASEFFPIDFCNLGGWLQTASITADTLAQAKAENCWTLNIVAKMYAWQDSAVD